MFGKRVKLRKRILNRSTNKHDEQTFALPPRKIVFHAFRASCTHEVNSMEGSPWRIRHRSDPSEHSDWPPLRFSFRRFRSDPTSWKELLLKKKTDSPFSRIAGSRSVSQFSSISRSPFLPVRLQTFQSTRVILFFNICYLWRYYDYGDRRFESYERYFIILLDGIECNFEGEVIAEDFERYRDRLNNRDGIKF